MQKREQSKLGGAAGGSATPAAKRGRPIGSGGNSGAATAAAIAAAAAAGDAAAPSTLLGPSLQVHSAFAEQNNKRIVMALQSGLKSELTWALNALTLLSFKEKDEVRKDATPLAKIPGLLDALLQVIDDWRDIALPRVLTKTPRVRLLGANSAVSGFGNEYETVNSGDSVPHPTAGSGSSNKDLSAQKFTTKASPSGWWFEEDGLFNLEEEGRAEKQLCAVAASNILRNFSFMAENEIAMGQNRHCLETMFQCLEDYVTEDEELVTNALETIMNLGPLIDLRIFSSSKPSYIKITEKRAVQAIMGLLGSAVRSWHCAAAEILGRLILNPDNELSTMEPKFSTMEARKLSTMEDALPPQNLTLNSLETAVYSFPPHRRRPLRSRTYDAFIRILSHCSTSVPQLQLQVDSGDFQIESMSKEDGSITLNEADSADALVPLPNSKSTKDMVAQDDSNDESKNAGLQDGLDGKQATLPKLHHLNSVTDGEQEVTPSNRISIVENQMADSAIQNAKEQESVKSLLDIQMDGFEVDNEFGIHDFSKVIESSKVGEDSHEKGAVLESMPKDAERELQLKEMELEKLIHNSGGMESTFHVNVDEEIEEGEISGEAGVADELFDALSSDVSSFGERTTEKMHASEDCLDNENLFCKDEDRGHLQHGTSDPSLVDSLNGDCNSMVMEIRTSFGQIQSFPQNISHDIQMETKKSDAVTHSSENVTPSGRIIQENAAENPISSTTEKDDDASNKKRKRGPPTKEKRAKKKKKERLKRAEKNRQLGVKRLKLHPNLKPKKIVYCRHYLQGRCHEGDKCNFSHDTVPLTKSKPCSHFARRSCMKGDECPFDHQLSNYPCTNYTSNGFCNRGSECLFSHEMPAKSCSTTPNVSKPDLMSVQHIVFEKGGLIPISNVTKPELKFISPLNSSNSSKMDIHGVHHKRVDAKYCSATNSPTQSAESLAANLVLRIGGQPPRGVSFLSNRGMSLGDTNKNKRDGSSEKTPDGVGLSSEVILKVPSGISELNKMSEGAAPRKPRGLNFLSFGRPSSPLPSKSDNVTVKSIKDDMGEGKHTCSWPQSGGILKVNRQMNTSATISPSDLNEKVNGTLSTVHQLVNLLSFNRDGSIGEETAYLHFNKGVKERESTSKLQDTIKGPFLSFGRKNANMSCSFTKSLMSNSPSLVQKAVQSTLAFAEKLDPNIKAGASLHQQES